MTFFTELEQKNSQFCGNTKDLKQPKQSQERKVGLEESTSLSKTSNGQNNLKKEKQDWRNQTSSLHNILQSHSDQGSMVLAQKQKYRPMDQARKPRDKLTHLWAPYL